MSRPLLLALALCILAAPAAAEAPAVHAVASFSILGDMTRRIGGDRVAVDVLVGPDGDAHVYQPTPADAERIAKADVVIVNGLGFEGFLDRLLRSADYAGRVVVASAAIAPRTGFVDADEAADTDHPADPGLDPHAWQSLANGALYAAAIRDGLCDADAAGCPAYRANAEAYIAEITALDAEVHARIAAIPAARRKVITSHDAFGYFGAAYGVTFLAPQGLSTESEAGAGTVAAMVRQIRQTGITTLFLENVVDPRLMEAIATETGATVGPPLYSDALSPPDGPAPTYLAMIRHNVDALVAAMASGT